MLMETRSARLNDDQRGFAAIIIALVLILILSLITVGFAQLMRREQRSALDKQLSSQAYYAAESGVNVAAKAINAGYFQGTPPTPKSTCGTISGDPYFSTNNVGINTGASYPCLLVNPTPPNLQYGSIDTTDTKVVEMTGVSSSGSAVAIKTIEISWEDANGNNTFAPPSYCNNTTFYPASAGSPPTWTYTGLLRAELIPIKDLSRSGLTNNAYTAFLCPDTSASTGSDYVANHGIASGVIVHGGCTTNPATPTAPRHCNAQITGLGTGAFLDQTTYFLALRSIYSPTAVTITAYGLDGTGNVTVPNLLNISGAQILVDSTGKAQDVLRRVQVRIPVHNNYDIPNGTGAMSSICKQLQLTPGGGTSNPGNCVIP